VAKSRNRRVADVRDEGRAKRGARSRRHGRSRNRKVKGGERSPDRPQLDPADRRARNRAYLLLALLVLVNVWVFVWRDEATVTRLVELPEAVVQRSPGPLPPMAEAPDNACGGHPVRIFHGLEHLIRLETSLAGGRTLRLGLLDLGVTAAEIDAVEAAIRGRVDLGLLEGSGAPVRLATDRHGGVQALEIELAEGHLLQACRSGETLAVRNIQHPLRSDVLALGFELGRRADLAEAVEAAGEAPELASLVTAALAHDVDFLVEARPGDRVQVMVEKRWLGRAFHRYGKLLAVRYIGAAGRLAYYRYKPEGEPEGLFDGKGRGNRRVLLRSPIAYHRVDPDAREMLVPVIEIVGGRIGSVYRQPEGAPVVAIADAVVRFAGRRGDEGLSLELETAAGLVVRYAHLMRLIGTMEPGTRVEQGQLVGLAGHTGKTATDRIRLEIWRTEEHGEESVDPMILTARGDHRSARTGASIPDKQKRRFVEDIRPWSRALRVAGR
jgi:murein DD-endopeptidase MepM/ murein hydrolase activator NlpD